MIGAVECMYQGKLVSVAEAIEIRERNKTAKGLFNCRECSEAVRPHKSSDDGKHPAHFEHFVRNPECSYSASGSGIDRPRFEEQHFDVGDACVIEGIQKELKTFVLGRNAKIARERKQRDDYRCQACHFRLSVNGRYVIECHHIEPVSDAGIREVTVNDLVSLCPTCHRISHTRKPPYSIKQIQRFLEVEDPQIEKTASRVMNRNT